MTADFENDEIKDSSFPIDFTEETTALDMYGVWVKSGPRDASTSPNAVTTPSLPDTVEISDFPETPNITVPESGVTIEHAFEDYPDIATLPDLPDFPDVESSIEVESNEESESPEERIEGFETIEFEPLELETTDRSQTSMPSEDIIPAEGAESHDLESINLESFTESLGVLETSAGDLEGMTLEPSVAEAMTDRETEVVTEPFEETSAIPDIVFDEELSINAESEEFVPTTEDFTMGDQEVAREQEMELPKQPDEVILDDGKNIELSLEDFMGSVEPDKTAVPPSEEDLSTFLDDLNESPGPATTGSDDFDLDSLISSVNEAGSLDQKEENLFDDTEPLPIELEFDEAFIEDAEKIRATGSSVSESEFFNSEFGVELVDETSRAAPESRADTSGMDFDAMLAAVEQPGLGARETENADISGSVMLEATSEFDDLLQSLDAAPVPAPVSDKKAPITASKGFDLAVTEEDSMDSITTSVSEASFDEDFTVSLTAGASEAAVQANEKVPEPAMRMDVNQVEEDLSIPLESFEMQQSIPEVQEPLETSESISLEESIHQNEFEEVSAEEIVDLSQIKDYNIPESNLESDQSERASVEESVPFDFDDISAVEKELNEENPVTGETTVVINDKSTELLMIIADELSSIKKEISTLKSELAGFKTGSNSEGGAPSVSAPASENSGFFSDDDTDETIALTGDELNNILITADFTEEKSDGDVPEEPATVGDTVSDDTAIPDFTSVTGVQSEENEPEIPETLPETIFDVPGFDTTESIEVSHVNALTDDVSYLEGSDTIEPDLDNVAIEEPELEIIDFEDEKLEEPELTEFNIDLTGMEQYPPEQDISVSESPVVEELTVPAESFSQQSEGFATTETLSNDELASIGQDVSIPETDVSETTASTAVDKAPTVATMPVDLKDEIKSVLTYMDQLLESLPEDKIEEFARSEHFEVYKKLFEELGIS